MACICELATEHTTRSCVDRVGGSWGEGKEAMESTVELQSYAIINKRTCRFVYGTDYRYHPYQQRTSPFKAIIYDDLFFAEVDFKCRRCGRDYKIVKVDIVVRDK